MNSYCTFSFYIKPGSSDSNCMEAKHIILKINMGYTVL